MSGLDTEVVVTGILVQKVVFTERYISEAHLFTEGWSLPRGALVDHMGLQMGSLYREEL